MNKTLLIALAFSLAGCTQLNNLLGGKSSDDKTIHMHGIWSGTMNLDGRAQPVTLNIWQDKTSVLHTQGTGSYLAIDHSGTMSAGVWGDVGSDSFLLTADEGTACVNKWTIKGDADDHNMTITISGNGNKAANCYPSAINQTVKLTRP